VRPIFAAVFSLNESVFAQNSQLATNSRGAYALLPGRGKVTLSAGPAKTRAAVKVVLWLRSI
jgi:hypothetical protein